MPGTERNVTQGSLQLSAAGAGNTNPLPPVAVVTGMAFEARIAAGSGVRVVCQQNATLAGHLESMLKQGCRGIVSFGTAGGLVDGLRPGTWVVARAVLDGAQRFATDAAWSQILCSALPGAQLADVAGVTFPVTDSAAKRALHRDTGAAAADMESHIAARMAEAHGVPFVCCRVVIDPVERSLPDAAIAGLRDDGTTDVWAVLRSLAAKPSQLPALLRVAGDARRAKRSLALGRRSLGDAFGYLGA